MERYGLFRLVPGTLQLDLLPGKSLLQHGEQSRTDPLKFGLQSRESFVHRSYILRDRPLISTCHIRIQKTGSILERSSKIAVADRAPFDRSYVTWTRR